MSVVLAPPDGFGCFAEFFARRLSPDARPICGDPFAVVSPCDAAVLDLGQINPDSTNRINIKGFSYNIRDLIGDAGVAEHLGGGGYCLLYLHPRDYHRVHVPMDGTLREVRYMPGARYPMAPWASSFANGALAKNERVAFDIELEEDGRRCVVLMIAAFGVGGIESPYLTGPANFGKNRTALASVVTRGDELGAFRIGSSVILLWPKGAVELDSSTSTGRRVLVGQAIGLLRCTDLKKV
jgi:phosphatidylserine decarboxylase